MWVASTPEGSLHPPTRVVHKSCGLHWHKAGGLRRQKMCGFLASRRVHFACQGMRGATLGACSRSCQLSFVRARGTGQLLAWLCLVIFCALRPLHSLPLWAETAVSRPGRSAVSRPGGRAVSQPGKRVVLQAIACSIASGCAPCTLWPLAQIMQGSCPHTPQTAATASTSTSRSPVRHRQTPGRCTRTYLRTRLRVCVPISRPRGGAE